MGKINKVEKVVKFVLENSKQSREDNFILVYLVYRSLYIDVNELTFQHIMLNHKALKLPSFESITRARRKLQSKYDYLKPNNNVLNNRFVEEKKYISYSKE